MGIAKRTEVDVAIFQFLRQLFALKSMGYKILDNVDGRVSTCSPSAHQCL